MWGFHRRYEVLLGTFLGRPPPFCGSVLQRAPTERRRVRVGGGGIPRRGGRALPVGPIGFIDPRDDGTAFSTGRGARRTTRRRPVARWRLSVDPRARRMLRGRFTRFGVADFALLHPLLVSLLTSAVDSHWRRHLAERHAFATRTFPAINGRLCSVHKIIFFFFF